MTDDEKFFAWLDGELSGPEADAIAERVAADPSLSKLADEHKAMQSRLKAALDSVAEMPVPDRLLHAISTPGTVIDFGAARTRRRAWLDLAWPQWTAMAATLALGIFLGTMIAPGPTGPVEVDRGRLYAAGALGQALDTRLASTPAGNGARVGVTFRDRSGTICRSFAEGQSAGLACRSGDRWQVRGLFAGQSGEASEYRMASSIDPRLAALIESTIAGEPFDAAEEKAARARGWR